MPSRTHQLRTTVALVAIATIALDPTPSVANPDPSDNELAAQADALLIEWDRYDAPGVALGVIKGGRFVYQRCAGMANLEHAAPITPDTVFSIASMSKQFTAFAILLLASEERLSLADDVRSYIPELPIYDHNRPIAIRHLMYHTSGLRDQLTLAVELAGVRTNTDHISLDEQFNLIIRQRGLCFPTGSRYQYGNTAYYLMALIVERVGGMSFKDFSRTRIFEPLGMASTTIQDDVREVIPHRAQGYNELPDGSFRITRETFPTIGCAGVLTSLNDLAKWDQNFYSKGVGGEWVIEQMTNSGKTTVGELTNYAGGLYLHQYQGLRLVEHSGGQEGFYSLFHRFPNQRLSVIMLTNGGRPIAPAARELHTAVIEFSIAEFIDPDPAETEPPQTTDDSPEDDAPTEPDEPTPSPIDLPADALARFAATYASIEHRTIIEIRLEDSILKLVSGGGSTYDLEAMDEHHFRFAVAPSTGIEFGRPDLPDHLFVTQSAGADPLEFRRVDPLSPEDKRAIAGRYYSPEIDTTYTLSFDRHDDAIVVTLDKHAGRLLIPEPFRNLGQDHFVTDSSQDPMFEFHRGDSARVIGLTFHAMNLITLEFERVEE